MSLLLISVVLTLVGLNVLIRYHVDQTVRLSKIEGLKIRATTLAYMKMNELDIQGMNEWSYAAQLSALLSKPSNVEDS